MQTNDSVLKVNRQSHLNRPNVHSNSNISCPLSNHSPLRVQHMALKRWVATIASEPLPAYEQHERNHSTSPFPVDPRLNNKLALWAGDLTALDCDAIVNPTNESLTDGSALGQRLFNKAGHSLVEHVRRQIQTCRTGDLKVSEGFGLACRHILHTVGPKYKPQFHSAAETALFLCYQRVLNCMLDYQWSSLAIPPIHTVRRGYPPQDGAHIALRTIRRFLEKYHDRIDLIVLAVEDIDFSIYEAMLPLYFPRNQAEQRYACYKLCKDIGGPNGEPVLPERAIRIQDKPVHLHLEEHHGDHDDHETIDLHSGLEASVAIGKSSFAWMQADIDQQWLKKKRQLIISGSTCNNKQQNLYGKHDSVNQHHHDEREHAWISEYNRSLISSSNRDASSGNKSNPRLTSNSNAKTNQLFDSIQYSTMETNVNLSNPLQKQLTHQMRFEALLRASHKADVSIVSRLDWLYANGYDRLGRKVLVLIGANLPHNKPMLQLCFLQLIRCLDRLRTGHDNFALLYVHSDCDTSKQSSAVQFMRSCLDLIPINFAQRLSNIYILHAGMWFRMTSWWFVQFKVSWIKSKILFISSLAELDSILPLLELRLPQFVLDHDFKVNGLRYVGEDVVENL